MTVLSNRVRQWLWAFAQARISPRRKRAKFLHDEDIGWLIDEYEHAYPNEEEGQGPFGYLLKEDLIAGWRATLLASELITMATVTAAAKQARTKTGFRSAKSGVMMPMLSLLFANKTKAKPR